MFLKNSMRTKIKNTILNLHDYFGANKSIFDGGGENPFFEGALSRKYNHATRSDNFAVRMVFLNSLTRGEKAAASRLVKNGKPLWCYAVKYAGVCPKTGYRQISFALSKKSKKRFCVGEQHILVIPSRVRIYPKFWDAYKQRCSNFGSVFAYTPIISMMWSQSEEFRNGEDKEVFLERLESDNPLKIGTLIQPRMGLFSPWPKRSALLVGLKRKYIQWLADGNDVQIPEFEEWCRKSDAAILPPGVIMSRNFVGPSPIGHNIYGKEKLRVQMGGEIFEDLHPNEIEIILGEN